MGAHLHRVILAREIIRLGISELAQLFLRAIVKARRQCRLQIATDHPLEIRARFRMIRNHLRGEGLLVSIALLLRDLCRLDLEHIAHRGFLDEVRRLRSNAEGRIDAGFLCRRLRKGCR